uniref:CN hydrolase domain-containing protein n=1 Tax=Eutreptiella gymnastica TaxID=73025 RepID=A0A7S4FQZ3_9EUGL|mmetsp:Transcript_53877/g.89674  ORF Transcript_53877/g.89674 Transcript_53877/m.89674 type:complete len:298 (+) Transcript_53877:19-912(+)
MRLKVVAVQYDAAQAQPLNNMHKVDTLLRQLTKEDGVDILVLPEMAFTGYTFSDRKHISDLVETDGGTTEQWCRRHAMRLHCTVFCGFPYKPPMQATQDTGQPNDTDVPYFNSMLIVGPDGNVLERYHKHFLYTTDETWATPGDEFKTVTLPSGVKVGMAICMDINPHKFEAPWEAYELANHCLKEKVQVVVFCSNWCNCHPDDPMHVKNAAPELAETLEYWVARMKPLIGHDVYFVAADRVGKESLSPLGKEGKTTFCGGSSVISLKEPRLLKYMDCFTEGLLVDDFNVIPRPAAV